MSSININGFGAELFAPFGRSSLSGAYNTAYLAHFVRPNASNFAKSENIMCNRERGDLPINLYMRNPVFKLWKI